MTPTLTPPRRPAGERPGERRPDASMDLLLQVLRQPVDPDYARVAARDGGGVRHPWRLAAVLVLVGVLFAVAAVQTTRSAPAAQTERDGLVARVQAAGEEQDRLRAQANALTAENAALRSAALGGDVSDQSLRRRLDLLEAGTGAAPVTGPGLVVVVDDAPGGDVAGDAADRVLDVDLQLLVNGLWEAGAEAVAVNGHRLSALTAIRSAGDAITVDYRSLTRPYRVEAVGDPRTLPAALAETASGRWWHDLAQGRGMRYDVATAEQLTLSADPGLTLRWAEAPR